MIPVSWQVSTNGVTLTAHNPDGASIPGVPIATAPPGGIFVYSGGAYGLSRITATNGTVEIASLPAIHYPSLSFGCLFRFTPAFAFDPDRTGKMQSSSNWLSADLYDTFPANGLQALDPCYSSPLAETAPSEIWHVPFGGTFLPVKSLQNFSSIC